MATSKSVWGIDIGQCALKAIKLRSGEGGMEVEAFDIIEHAKILSEPEADRHELIRVALESFLSRNSVEGCDLAIAVPGQSSFTRFVKLPPVESKRIPDIVRFEAEQQIPFPIDDVIWRWQTFQDADSPDVEVGIFAMKRTDIGEMLGHFSDVELPVNFVQMAPLSLYNFMTYDDQVADQGATLLVDVGADKSDLVVADGPRIWTRTIQVGGNNFTETLAKAFKLSFAKAEKLKRTAATSKYARQIFQTMRPVFADLVQEIQRSIGYYTSLHRETRFKRLVGLGNGFRLPGLQKFLEQNLNIQTIRVDSYNKLTPASGVNAAAFTENVLGFGVAYGLALQGLGQAKIQTNLLPQEVSRKRLWASKRPYFAAAGAMVLTALAIPLARAHIDRSKLTDSSNMQSFQAAQSVVRQIKSQQGELNTIQGQGTSEQDQVQKFVELYAYRQWWPTFTNSLSKAVEQAFPEQPLLSGINEDNAKKNIEQLGKRKRNTRQVMFIEQMKVEYVPDLAMAQLVPAAASGAFAGGAAPAAVVDPSAAPQRGFKVIVTARTPLDQRSANARLGELRRYPLGEQSNGLFKVKSSAVLSFKPVVEPVAAAGGAMGRGMMRPMMPVRRVGPDGRPLDPNAPLNPDPMFPTEDMSQDQRFEIGWLIEIAGDGIERPKAAE